MADTGEQPDWFAEAEPAASDQPEWLQQLGDLSAADRDQVMAFIAERLQAAIGRKAGRTAPRVMDSQARDAGQ